MITHIKGLYREIRKIIPQISPIFLFCCFWFYGPYKIISLYIEPIVDQRWAKTSKKQWKRSDNTNRKWKVAPQNFYACAFSNVKRFGDAVIYVISCLLENTLLWIIFKTFSLGLYK